MAGKHAQSPYDLDSTGLSFLAQFPPRISLNSPLLASEITLPPHPLIHCWVYTSSNGSDPLISLETARRNLVRENKSLPVTTAVLPRVHVAQDSRASALYIFSIGSQDTSTSPSAPIPSGNSEGLVCSESYHFSPDDLYPCSTSCSTQLIPCPSCLSILPSLHTPETWSSACLLPRIPLRRPFAEFIHAVRDHIIEDIVQSSVSNKYGTNHRHAVRYKQGVLLGPPHATSAEWGIGWDHDARQRSLVYCELLLHLYPARILVHPVLHSAHLLPLLTTPPSSVAAGVPITLLPHGTPAYYLNTYTGPLGNLTTQFDAAFRGLGVGDWKSSSVIPKVSHSGHATGTAHNSHITQTPPTYVIAWLAVQNRHGEDKGMPIIWPSSLCFAPISSFPHPRPSLKFLPLVPAQLLASPPAPLVKVASLKLSSNVLAPPFQFDEQPTPSPVTTSARGSISGPSSSEPGLPAPQATAGSVQAPRPIRPSLSRAQTADSLRAFRSLTVTRKHAKTVASEVSTYVDAVARERERERERLKREREGGSLSRSGSGAIKPLDKSHETKSASSSPKKMSTSVSVPKLDVDHRINTPAPAPSRHIAPPIVPAVDLPKNEPVELALPAGGIHSTATITSSDTARSTIIKEEVIPPANSGANVTAESSNAFDPFSGFDSNWNQSNNDFMGMSLDNYDLNMGFSMAMNGAGDGGDTFNMDDGFGVFTDDDFNFFDSPATTAKATIPTAVNGANPSGIFPLNESSLANDGLQTSGPGPPSAITQAQPIPWLNSALGEGMTPLSLGAPTPVVAAPPELVPSTPTQTPPSHSAPVTPSVQLADQLQSCHIRRSSISSSFSSSFDPIPFAPSHRQADGKYALGKFAMATPPPDDEEVLSSASTSKPPTSTWQSTYRTATDPRIGIVRRLAGAKRKRLGIEQEEHQDRRGSVWLREHEEWASESVPEETDSDMDAGQSDSEEDEDDAMNEDRSPSISRVHTPPPSYLPLGPTLVQTQFQHQYLLPLCVPLRPSGTDPEVAIGISAPLMSAPTPVSPAAILGAPSERSKALEGAAQILIKEVVENSVWRECWQASLVAAQGNCKSSGEIWMSDVRSASQLLKAVHGTGPSLTIEKTFVSDDMQALRFPRFAVAKSDSVIQVLPSALRFWEKLGLHPWAGGKHLTAYTFFEEEKSDDETESRISDWLDKLSAIYTAKNYGTHTLGRSATCTRDGCVPVKFGELRKTLVSFVASLPELESPLVFYIVTPTYMMNLASSPMRQVFSAIKKVKKTYPDAPILIHLLPEPLILGALHIPALNYGGLEAVADAIYNRAVLPITRNMSRVLLPNGEKERALFGEPAFVIQRVMNWKVKFCLEEHPSTLDVMNRGHMLHIGYTISECGKWLFAAFIDEKGDSHDLRAWLVPDDEPVQFVINNVWDFATTIAKKAHVEWHIIITRLGAIPVNELHAWTSRLNAASVENQHLPPLQAHLLVANIEELWNFLAPDEATTSRTSKHPSGAAIADFSSTFYLLRTKIPTMVSSSASVSTEPSFVADTEEDKPLEESQIRSLLSCALIRVPAGTDHIPISMLQMNLLLSMHATHAGYIVSDQDTLNDAARNFHDLAVLTQWRWKLNADPILPFHLAALEAISLALSRSDVTAD